MFILPLLLFATLAFAGLPSHSGTSFPRGGGFFFFDNSESAIHIDYVEGRVYVSLNSGKSWNRAEGIPDSVKIFKVIQHPFNNSYAFALTTGLKHYSTSSRGKSWQPFQVPVDPHLAPTPLSFHSDPKKYGYILYHGFRPEKDPQGQVRRYHGETYYTKEAFAERDGIESQRLILNDTSTCLFAHSSKEFVHNAHDDLIYCLALDQSSKLPFPTIYRNYLLHSSTDFFQKDNKVEDLGIGRNVKGVIGLSIVSKFALVRLRDLSPGGVWTRREILYATVDTVNWARAEFPQSSFIPDLHTIVETTTHSLAVDILSYYDWDDNPSIGSLFVSNSNGTNFVQSLKNANRNRWGNVDYERMYGMEGIWLSNIVGNAEYVGARPVWKRVETRITFNDGRSWAPLNVSGKGPKLQCDPKEDACSLHLHLRSVAEDRFPGRIFSSPAPGYAMGVGNVGAHLKPYEECSTFLSTDAGLTWTMIKPHAYKYQFGDSGRILVLVKDEEGVDSVEYSLNGGKDWKSYNFGIRLYPQDLVTAPDNTSPKFILLGDVAERYQKDGLGRFVIIYLDFTGTLDRKCSDSDFERFDVQPHGSECFMGHKQWYRRRKLNTDCYVGSQYAEPITDAEDCVCTDADYECDFNFNYTLVHCGCTPLGPESFPAGACGPGSNGTYMGSSGWRKVPGNTCQGGDKDKPIEKSCDGASQAEDRDTITRQIFEDRIVQRASFKQTTVVLARLNNGELWQSPDQGYSWVQPFPEKKFVAFHHHPCLHDHAYLLTTSKECYYTTDDGQSWKYYTAPSLPNMFHAQFHPEADQVTWTADEDCTGDL